jgi:transposase-like protein
MEDQSIKKKQKPQVTYSESFKKRVVQELDKGLLNMSELQAKYGIGGNSNIARWSKKYGNLRYQEKALLGRPMKDKLKQRIKELERQLEDEKFKVLAYETLIEIVKQEDGIDLLKKGGAKQSVSLPKPAPEK